MPTLKKMLVERALKSKLKFKKNPAGRGKHHVMYQFQLPGSFTIVTKVSHGSKNADIDASLVARMAEQMRISIPYFCEIVRCTKSRDEYFRDVAADPHPSPRNVA